LQAAWARPTQNAKEIKIKRGPAVWARLTQNAKENSKNL